MIMPFQGRFNHADLPTPLNWFNPPDKWEIENGSLIIYPGKTDFWQKTHYGFSCDNGHFFSVRLMQILACLQM